MSFVAELKRRNVFRVGIAYAVMAWLVLQVADVLIDNIGAPDWLFPTVLMLLGIGFLLALFLAWAFELTPEGLKREKDVDRSESITRHTGRKLDFAIIGLLVLALGYFIWESRFSDPAPTVAAPAAMETDDAVTESVAATSPSPTAAETATPAGIVVLPFVNMSADPDQEYFSDGLSEEILNALAQIEDLRVISRTSAFAFKGKDLSIPDIAQQLQVSHVLEGSVRTAGDQVRITAQLIEVESDSHLWSEAYSRSLENVFEVQEEISLAIADELQLRLSDSGTEAGPPTRSTEAYRLFLRGRHHYQVRGEEDLQLALPLLEQAVAIDPEFDEAWANLAATRMVAAFYAETGHEALYRQAGEAANTAIRINPDNGFAHAVLGLLAYRDLDFEQAIEQYDRAIELNPNESNSYLWKGITLSGLGYMNEAIDVMKEAEAFDPAFTNLHNWIAGAYLSTGDTDLALRHRDLALAVDPAFAFNNHADLVMIDGGLEAADAINREITKYLPDTETAVDAYLLALRDPSQTPAAVAAIQAAQFGGWVDPTISWLWRLGAVEEAMEAWRGEVAAGRSLRAVNALSVFWLALDRDNLSHEAVAPFIEEVGIADYWRAHGDPDFCRSAGDTFECGAP